MPRLSTIALCLLVLPSITHAQDSVPPAPVVAPAPAVTASTPAKSLPPMYFVSTVAKDDILSGLKANPALSTLDGELVGSPLMLIVTHTVRPAAGAQTTSMLTGILSGSTLGLIPVVSKETLVVRYEVRLNGKDIASYHFEYTGSRSINIWAEGNDGYEGLGKAGMEWVKSTAPLAAAKLAQDKAIQRARDEIDFYFPPAPSNAG